LAVPSKHVAMSVEYIAWWPSTAHDINIGQQGSASDEHMYRRVSEVVNEVVESDVTSGRLK